MRLWALRDMPGVRGRDLKIETGAVYEVEHLRDWGGTAFVRLAGDRPGRWLKLEHFSETAPERAREQERVA